MKFFSRVLEHNRFQGGYRSLSDSAHFVINIMLILSTVHST